MGRGKHMQTNTEHTHAHGRAGERESARASLECEDERIIRGGSHAFQRSATNPP